MNKLIIRLRLIINTIGTEQTKDKDKSEIIIGASALNTSDKNDVWLSAQVQEIT